MNCNVILRRALAVTTVLIAGMICLLYAGDYLSVRYRVPGNREQFGWVTIQSYDAIKEKNGKTEYIFSPPVPQTCVQALFPHFGYVPCWYLKRHSEPRTNI